MSLFPKGTDSSIKKDRVPFAFPRTSHLLALLAFVMAPVYANAQVLKQPAFDELRQMSSLGLSGFAQTLADQYAPSLAEQPEEWLTWQKQKVKLLQQQGAWSQIIQLNESAADSVPVELRSWLVIQAIDAYLHLGDGEAARDLVLAPLWASSEDSMESLSAQTEILRRQIMQSYLVQGRIADASSASVRYLQDYPASKDEAQWRASYGRLLLANGDLSGAAVATVMNQESSAKAVNLIARIKSLVPLDSALLQDVFSVLRSPQIDPELRYELFVAVLARATAIESWSERIQILEDLARIENINHARMTALADALWFAYAGYGEEIVSRLQLLRGNYKPWFESAGRMMAASSVQGVSLYAYMEQSIDDVTIQTTAHQSIVSGLEQHGKGGLIGLLYLSASQFADVTLLPNAVMYRLVDTALSSHDLGLASKLMSQFEAPSGVALADWQLRRARVQVLAGVPDYGVDLLKELVSSYHLNSEQTDYVIQIVFDLQNRRLYRSAYDILEPLLANVPNLATRREVLFLMADSLAALNQQTDAVRLFLRSAMLDPDNMNDDWGQAARYRAAQVMMSMGLIEDGLTLYRDLLSVAQRPQWRVRLQREIQLYTSSQ